MRELLILIFLMPTIALGEEVSFVKSVPKNLSKESVEVPLPKKIITEKKDTRFEKMQEFILKENERLNAIRILNLDLEQTNLELKKREAEVKLAQLNGKYYSSDSVIASGVNKKPDIKLAAIYYLKNQREASFNINGKITSVRVGNELIPGVSVKKIDADFVTVLCADGKEENFILGS